MRIGFNVPVAALLALAAGAAAAQSGPKDCTAAAHRQLDSRVGDHGAAWHLRFDFRYSPLAP